MLSAVIPLFSQKKENNKQLLQLQLSSITKAGYKKQNPALVMQGLLYR